MPAGSVGILARPVRLERPARFDQPGDGFKMRLNGRHQGRLGLAWLIGVGVGLAYHQVAGLRFNAERLRRSAGIRRRSIARLPSQRSEPLDSFNLRPDLGGNEQTARGRDDGAS